MSETTQSPLKHGQTNSAETAKQNNYKSTMDQEL